MSTCRKNFNILVFCFTINVVALTTIFAQNNSPNFISESLPQLKLLSSDINQNVLVSLAIIKEYEKCLTVSTNKIAKIIKPLSFVKESDNNNSINIAEVRMDDEFAIIEARDNWYKIRLQDNREGWVSEEDVQELNVQSTNFSKAVKLPQKQKTTELLDQMRGYKSAIDKSFESAGALIKKIEEGYNNLPADKKKAVQSNYQSFKVYKEKIEKYLGYSARFLEPYESLWITSADQKSVRVAPGDRFKGTASVDVGRSSYNNMNSTSTTSRRLAFDGIYQIDKLTRLDISLNQQKELIQSAFTNSRIEAGISRQFSDKFIMGSNIGFDSYDDKASAINSFGLFRARVNFSFTPTTKSNVFGNANFQSKNFKETGDNNYQGILYVFGTNLMPNSKNNIRLQIQGNKQVSGIDFLTFNQVSPQINYTLKKSLEKSFSIRLDYDLLKFAENNNINNYRKYRADFLWRNNLKKNALTKNLNLTYKQFPNNSKKDYFRLGYTLNKRKGSLADKSSSVSSLSSLATIITQRENNFLSDYLDLRWDKSKINPNSYSNINVLTRLWNNSIMKNDSTNIPDHFLDFYGELGPYFRNNTDGSVKFTDLKLGLIFGGHLFFNFDDEYFIRNGNSLRGGFSLKSNIKIYRANLTFNGSYERSLILSKQTTYDPFNGNILYGDILYRSPSSFQFLIDYLQPVYNNWDIHFGLNTYYIKTDATDETSINPIDRKSNLRYYGGLIYRFAL